MPDSVPVTFPWTTKLSGYHGLVLSERAVLSGTHLSTGVQPTKLIDAWSSFCGSLDKIPIGFQGSAGAASALWMYWLHKLYKQ